MLAVPAVALAIIAVSKGSISKMIAVASTLIVLIMVLWVLALSMESGSMSIAEGYPYISSLGIGLEFSINIIQFMLLIMSSVVLLAAALSGNPEGERPKLSCALVVLFQISSIGLFTSANLFLFFIFWDIGVAVLFFMINILGSANRRSASINFIVYEIFASALLLLGIMLIYFYTPLHSFNIQYIIANASQIPASTQGLIFLVFFAAFMTNMPLFPMHFWLPAAHTEASTQGSMLLSGVLTKYGGYGMLLLFTMMPVASAYAVYIAALAAISAFYSVFVLMKQTDIKRIVAYSTVVEMSIIMIGISALNDFGKYGSAYAMLAHGLSIALMFLVAGSIKYAFGERDMKVLRGIVLNAKSTAYAFLLGTLAMIGFPLTPGFIADILIFMGSIQSFGLYGALPLLALILMGAYMYFVISKSILSTKEHSEAVNFTGVQQDLGYSLLALFIFLFGALPFVLLNFIRV
jgi:NADH-quinone oxidoreductase subunit M